METPSTTPSESSIRTVHEVERDHIIQTLKLFSYNRIRACAALGISIRTLRNKITLYLTQGHMIPIGVRGGHNKGKKRVERVDINCHYCGEKIGMSSSLYKQRVASGQKNFYCCREHFHNQKHTDRMLP